MRDRSTLIDLALVFAATSVITLAFWPKTTPRQIVRCNSPEQGWKTYSIAINDPSLVELKKKVLRWKTPEFNSRYATAKWQKEVAEFYQDCKPCISTEREETTSDPDQNDAPTTATISDTVTRASYEVPENAKSNGVRSVAYIESAESGLDVESSPSDEIYWSTVKASAEASIKAVEQRSANVPVVFETITSAGWPQLAFHFAFLAGISSACGYMHWMRFAPTRRGKSFREQSPQTLARIGTFCAVTCFALISSIAVWI